MRTIPALVATTARHRAIDRLRRDRVLAAKLPLLAQQPEEAEDVMDGPPIPDERLELGFMCSTRRWPSTRRWR